MSLKPPSSRGRARVGGLLAAVALAVTSVLALPATASASAQHYDDQQLAAARAAVQRSGVDGIAWYVNRTSGKVVVTADSTVSVAEVATIRRGAGDVAGAIRIKRTNGVFTRLLSGGDAIYGDRYRCSLGFNVVKGGTYYFLTAGHCGKVAKTWYTDARHNTLIGPTIGYKFPGKDHALVRYDNTSLSHPGGFEAAEAYVGEQVKRTGSTTGTHSGRVTALDVTVRYLGGGTVRGMIQTDVCAEPGDSGGPLYDGSKALGITSGGSGDCKSGGTTFYEPVPRAAKAYGVTVY